MRQWPHFKPPDGGYEAASAHHTETYLVLPDFRQVKSLPIKVSRRRLRRLERDLEWLGRIAAEYPIPVKALLIARRR